jgi:hypothetical protein
MAPQFKKNMYQTYKKDIGSKALICFRYKWEEGYKSIFLFRDKLADNVSEKHDLVVSKCEGRPTPLDSWFRLFDKQDGKIGEDFFKRKRPGFICQLLKTEKWKDYNREYERTNKLVRFELGTSHDYTCIDVVSSIHSEDELSKLIETVATELNIEMLKNSSLDPAKEIVYSNRSFDL